MPTGVYPRTEFHKNVCRKNAKIGSRITKYNLPSIKNKNWSDENNPRWNGGKSGGYILKLCKQLKKKNQCEICKTTKNLIYHHKSGIRTKNTKKEIQILCYSCHAKIHNRNKNFKR